MIEGIKLDFATDELEQHLSERIDHHTERMAFYARQARQLREGGAARHEYTGGDPVDALNRSKQQHESKRDLLTVIRDHLVAGETYRLSEQDLSRIELVGERLY